MKNILFVGDLRSAKNYGAIATTEALFKLFEEENIKVNIRNIDFRSLYNPTPVNGFVPKSKSTFAVSILKFIVPNIIKRYIKYVLQKGSRQKNDYVPYKFSQYEEYYEKMVAETSFLYEKRLLEWADILYINGEGNIVNGTDRFGKYRMGARYILFIAWVSKVKYNKPTLMVNHTVDPNNYNAFEMVSNIYPYLDVVYVRETLSLSVLEKNGVLNSKFVPDALFSYKPIANWLPTVELKKQIDFSKPYICIGDSSGIKNAYSQVKWNVAKVLGHIIDELKKITPQVIFVDGYNGTNSDVNKMIACKKIGYVNLKNCSYHDLFYVLKGAQLFISGRWHASILSVLASTPILLWGSDSHKTKSLYTLLDYQYRFFEVSTLPVNIDELIDEAKCILENKEALKRSIKLKVQVYSESAKENVTILNNYI